MAKETKKSPQVEKLGSKVVKETQQVEQLGDHIPVISSEIHNAPKHKNIKLLLAVSILIGILAGSLAVFFTSAHKSFAKVYLGNTTINADIKSQQIQQLVNSDAKNYKLTLQYKDGTKKSYPLNTVGIGYDAQKTASSATQKLSKLTYQRLMWWQPVRIPLTTKINETALRAFIEGQATQATQAASDASLVIDNGKALIKPEASGKGDSIAAADKVIPIAVANMQSHPLVLRSGIIPPAITAKDLVSSKAKLDSILSQNIVLNIADKPISVSPSDIAGWVELTPVKASKTVDVNINSGNVVKYIDQIARPYVQPPRSRLVVNMPEGQQVLDPGKDGIDVINKDQAAAAIVQAVLAGKGLKIDLDVKYATAKTVEVHPYDKWIVVDVTTKRMYAYEQTNLVKSFLVSAGAPQTPTVLGQYAIYSKSTSQDMRGFNADGSRYFQPRVPYVNYFYADYAIHGNYWRPASYFGNINSSHGCVGVPVSDGEWIYNWAPVGTPVIVHN